MRNVNVGNWKEIKEEEEERDQTIRVVTHNRKANNEDINLVFHNNVWK